MRTRPTGYECRTTNGTPRPPARRARLRAYALAAVASLSAASALHAQSAPRAGRRSVDASIAVRASTLGYGVELGKLVASHVAVRAGGSVFSYNRTQDVEGVTYDGALKLRNASLLVDLFPSARGSFHVTGGVIAGSNDVSGRGTPGGDDGFTLGDNTYSAAEVGRLTGAVRFPRTRPYAGLGWGTPANRGRGIGLVTDFGVAFGKPEFELDATGPAGNDPQFRTDLEDQRVTTQEQLDQYARFYPVVSIGLTYRF